MNCLHTDSVFAQKCSVYTVLLIGLLSTVSTVESDKKNVLWVEDTSPALEPLVTKSLFTCSVYVSVNAKVKHTTSVP